MISILSRAKKEIKTLSSATKKFQIFQDAQMLNLNSYTLPQYCYKM